MATVDDVEKMKVHVCLHFVYYTLHSLASTHINFAGVDYGIAGTFKGEKLCGSIGRDLFAEKTS